MNATKKPTRNTIAGHQGQNIKRIRLLLDIQQKEQAAALGPGWTQKKVSRIESTRRVSLRYRQELARFYKVDIALFDTFDEAAGRMALMYIMKIKNQLASGVHDDDQSLLEDITDLLEKATVSIDRERQNMHLLLRLLQQIKFKSESWVKSAPVKQPKEMKEAPFRYGSVA